MQTTFILKDLSSQFYDGFGPIEGFNSKSNKDKFKSLTITMKIHDTKKDAIDAIKRYAKVMKEVGDETGADVLAEPDDDSGMEYYIEAAYKGRDKKVHEVRIHFQELNL